MNADNRPMENVGLGHSLSRRTVVRAGAAGGGALMFGGLFGRLPGLGVARAQEDGGSPLYEDLGSEEDIVAGAELFAGLDRVGSLDVSTGFVSIDPDGLKDVLSGYASGRRLERAYQAYLRHAELGFAVGGNPEAVARGEDVCVPWSTVEYLVGEGQKRLPLEYQYAILADLGLLEAQSADEVVAILRRRFPNVPRELGGVARSGGTRALPAAQEEIDWPREITVITRKVFESIKIDETKIKRDILDCIRSARLSVQWWGIQTCFDAACTETIIEYMNAGGNALTSSTILGLALSLKIPFWVAVIIAAGLLTWGIAAKVTAGALQRALDQSGGCGGCLDATWLIIAFGIPVVGASPNRC